MTELQYTIQLLADAEPGTGLGGKIINDRVPRDHRGRPMLPAAHVKGLMREELRALGKVLSQDSLSGLVLGLPGQREQQSGEEAVGQSGQESRCRLTDATLQVGASLTTGSVTRTAIHPCSGTAMGMSLRTTERIPADTVFHGRLLIDAAPGSREDLASRLALLSISAVGGGRTRGSGRCLVRIEGEARSPGALLRSLAEAAPSSCPVAANISSDPGEEPVLLRLVFRADGPICCPDRPVGTGVIRSGFAIPASAVQGALLTRLNSINSQLADNVFASEAFRAWPLLPCGFDNAPDPLPLPVFVSLTHRVAKLAVDGKRLTADEVADSAISDYDWTKVESASPLKASDGVLLRASDGTVQLWKASAMPRMLFARGVRHDLYTEGRNLYQMECMAPLTFSGLVSVPAAAAQILTYSLKADPLVPLGRSRSVHGMGRLELCAANDEQSTPWGLPGVRDVLIVQSPVLLPDAPANAEMPTSDEFAALVRHEWRRFDLPEVIDAWAVTGLRFGWNRHGHGMQTGRGRRLRASRVILPGSVLKFAEPLDANHLRHALIHGLGGGREQGFGALTIHPNMAHALYASPPEIETLGPSLLAPVVRWALDAHQMAKSLSPSQISAVEQRLASFGKDAARNYLKEQCNRTDRIWANWKPIIREVENLIERHSPEHAAAALRMLTDLALADRKDNNASRKG